VAAEVSIIKVFLAGFLPGILLTALFSGYIVVWALLNPEKTPREDRTYTLKEKLYRSRLLVPCMLLIVFADKLSSGAGIYNVIYLGAVIAGIGWGLVETVVNPLVATLYPDDKTAKLNVVHAWWPGGLVIGGLMGVGMTKLGLGWEAKLIFAMIPAIAITITCIGLDFPPTERAAAGVSMGQMFRELCSQRLSSLYDPCVLWWTEGSEFVQPTCLLGKGLPRPESFAALLDGAWFGQPWQPVPGLGEETAQTVSPTQSTELPVDLPPPSFRSVGRSDIGRVRAVNQDSFLERADVGLWVVADGVGGLSQGEVASRMVCDSLADVTPDGAFEALVDAVGERLTNVNTHLIKAAERETDPVRSGSTVVVLLTRGTRYVVLWAGDSRVYRFRGGALEQLTRDHSESEIEGPGHGSSAVTRAVGGEATLSLDSARGRVSPGDRFLLCSDGLTRIVAEPTIQEWMSKSDLREAAEGLVAATLAAGAPDNVTVVLVEAYA